MMIVEDMARLYYPRLWSKDRLEALVAAGRLSEAEYNEITGSGQETVTVQEEETAS